MKKLAAFLSLLLLAACIGTTPQSKFYSLRPLENNNPLPAKPKLTIGIDSVEVPSYLDRPQIVTYQANGIEMNISEFNRWSEPLSSMIQQILAQDMAAVMPRSLVKVPASSRENFDYTVRLEVIKFDGTWNQQVNLDTWWTIANSDGNAVLRRRSRINLPVKNSYDNLVIQQSALLAELAGEIAATARKLEK